MDKITLIIADDHALIRQGLTKILSMDPDIDVVAQAADGKEAVRLILELRPQVVLMDINMPVMNGLEATRSIKEKLPDTGVIALTIHDDEEYVFEMVNAGVSGYVLKDIDADSLIQAVKYVAAGKSIIHPDITSKLLDQFQKLAQNKQEIPRLTVREQEVLQCMAQGLSNKEIGQELFISEKTVKNHITSILRKLGKHDRTQAVIFAFKHNMIAKD